MLRIEVLNISRLAPQSDYKYVVYINQRVIAEGIVTQHQRSEGWQALLRRIAEHGP